jgi:hypothetical protein
MLLDYLNVEFNVFINKYEDDFRFILISAAVFVGKQITCVVCIYKYLLLFLGSYLWDELFFFLQRKEQSKGACNCLCFGVPFLFS